MTPLSAEVLALKPPQIQPLSHQKLPWGPSQPHWVSPAGTSPLGGNGTQPQAPVTFQRRSGISQTLGAPGKCWKGQRCPPVPPTVPTLPECPATADSQGFGLRDKVRDTPMDSREPPNFGVLLFGTLQRKSSRQVKVLTSVTVGEAEEQPRSPASPWAAVAPSRDPAAAAGASAGVEGKVSMGKWSPQQEWKERFPWGTGSSSAVRPRLPWHTEGFALRKSGALCPLQLPAAPWFLWFQD